MNKLKQLWNNKAFNKLKSFVRFLLESKVDNERRRSVLKFYKSANFSTLSPEIMEGLSYLRHNKFSAYPFKWASKYENLMPKVYKDKESSFQYIFFEGKRMFFPKRYTEKEIIWIARGIFKEQDEKSPHIYLTHDFQMERNSIIVDAGVAEGNFALSVVEQAKKLYLVECDKEWMEALKYTFSPWSHKVVYIDKYLSDLETDRTASIDSLLAPEENESYFIKMDIEGYEQLALMGMKNIIRTGKKVKLDICTYHKKNDLEEIKTMVTKYGLKYKVSDSFMLYCGLGEIPEFRKVLLRAWK